MILSKFFSALTVVTVCVLFGISGCSLFCDDSQSETVTSSNVNEDKKPATNEVSPPSFETCKLSFIENLEAFKYFNKKSFYDEQFDDYLSREYKSFLELVNFQKVISDCLPSAIDNNAEAQYYVGYSYKKLHFLYLNFYRNHLISKDEALKKNGNSSSEYYKWFLKSAQLGYIKSQAELGEIFLHGLMDAFGVFYLNHDYKKAIEWLSKAASHNEVKAITNLASLYSVWLRPKSYPVKAHNLYIKAAELNDPWATWVVGTNILLGKGTKKNYEVGKKLLEKAAEMPVDYTDQLEIWDYYSLLAEAYEYGPLNVDKNGRLVKDHMKKALHYYQLSCDRGYGYSCKVLKEKREKLK